MPIPRILNQPDAHEMFEDYRLAREREARYVAVGLALPLPVAKRILAIRWVALNGNLKEEARR